MGGWSRGASRAVYARTSSDGPHGLALMGTRPAAVCMATPRGTRRSPSAHYGPTRSRRDLQHHGTRLRLIPARGPPARPGRSAVRPRLDGTRRRPTPHAPRTSPCRGPTARPGDSVVPSGLCSYGSALSLGPCLFTATRGCRGRFAVFGLWGRDPRVTVDRAKSKKSTLGSFCCLLQRFGALLLSPTTMWCSFSRE